MKRNLLIVATCLVIFFVIIIGINVKYLDYPYPYPSIDPDARYTGLCFLVLVEDMQDEHAGCLVFLGTMPREYNHYHLSNLYTSRIFETGIIFNFDKSGKTVRSHIHFSYKYEGEGYVASYGFELYDGNPSVNRCLFDNAVQRYACEVLE